MNITINENTTIKTSIENTFSVQLNEQKSLYINLQKASEEKIGDLEKMILDLNANVTDKKEFIARLKRDRIKKTEEFNKKI